MPGMISCRGAPCGRPIEGLRQDAASTRPSPEGATHTSPGRSPGGPGGEVGRPRGAAPPTTVVPASRRQYRRQDAASTRPSPEGATHTSPGRSPGGPGGEVGGPRGAAPATTVVPASRRQYRRQDAASTRPSPEGATHTSPGRSPGGPGGEVGGPWERIAAMRPWNCMASFHVRGGRPPWLSSSMISIPIPIAISIAIVVPIVIWTSGFHRGIGRDQTSSAGRSAAFRK